MRCRGRAPRAGEALTRRSPLEGFDISPDAFSICGPKETAAVKFFHDDLLATDKHFDLALGIDVFEHVEDYLDFLRRLRAKATYKVFHVPLELSMLMLARSSSLLAMRQSVGHLHHFSKETALASLADTGYRVIDYCYTPVLDAGLYELDWKARMLGIPRRVLARVAPDASARIFGGYSLLVLAE